MGPFRNLFAPLEVTLRESGDLLVPWRHNPFVHQQRALLVISRVRIVSSIFAVLVPLWSVIDIAVFPTAPALQITLLRMLGGAAFLALAWPWNIRRPELSAPLLFGAMLFIPPAFQFLTGAIIHDLPDQGLTGILKDVYGYLPFTVVAGLSVFPLTALEGILCAGLVFGLMVAAAALQPGFVLADLAGPAWLLLLVSGASVMSGMSQLQYMVALVRRVTYDTLTGALTRRAGRDLIDGLLRTAIARGRPLCIAFVDLDRFKEVNDGFGHDAGDAILKGAVAAMTEVLRGSDAIVRWGGEEFLLVLPETDTEGAEMVLQRIGERGLGFRPDGRAVTASIGLAERIAEGLDDGLRLIDAADRRMYEAKAAGRNCAVVGAGRPPLLPLIPGAPADTGASRIESRRRAAAG